MNFQQLCELADKEIRLGLHDRTLMERAMVESRGVVAHAHQIYWQLRATALQTEAKHCAKSEDFSNVVQLSRRLEVEEKRRSHRATVVGWLWVIACFSSLVGAYIFPRIALSKAFRGTYWFYAFAILGVASLIFAGIAFVASKRRDENE